VDNRVSSAHLRNAASCVAMEGGCLADLGMAVGFSNGAGLASV